MGIAIRGMQGGRKREDADDVGRIDGASLPAQEAPQVRGRA